MGRNEHTQQDQLWQSFVRGSNDAFSRIYELYARQMYLYGLHFCNDEAVVEDAIHDIFVKIHTNRAQLEDLRNVKLYLLISMKNTLLNHVKSKKVRFRIDLSSCSFIQDAGQDINTIVETKEQVSLQRQFIGEIEKNLSPRQKQAVYYRFTEHLHYSEIASMMEINTQSAKNLVQSSIKKIREIYPDLSGIGVLAVLMICIG